MGIMVLSCSVRYVEGVRIEGVSVRECCIECYNGRYYVHTEVVGVLKNGVSVIRDAKYIWDKRYLTKVKVEIKVGGVWKRLEVKDVKGSGTSGTVYYIEYGIGALIGKKDTDGWGIKGVSLEELKVEGTYLLVSEEVIEIETQEGLENVLSLGWYQVGGSGGIDVVLGEGVSLKGVSVDCLLGLKCESVSMSLEQFKDLEEGVLVGEVGEEKDWRFRVDIVGERSRYYGLYKVRR